MAESVNIVRGEDGRIDAAAINGMFAKCVEQTSSLKDNSDTHNGFIVGVRCLERLLGEVGVDAALFLNGVKFK